MAAGTHYEIFLKKNKKAGWTMIAAIEDREASINQARKLLKENPNGSVRVSKEVYQEQHRNYRSAPIFEEGVETMQREREKTGAAELPCSSPEDLSSKTARQTLRRALKAYLDRKRVTTMELLHRPDLAEHLEASGTDLQQAVQTVAIASAKESDASVHAYVKQLNELVKMSLTRLYQDDRNKRLPKFPPHTAFAEIVEKVRAKNGTSYKLRAAIADQLKPLSTYAEKMEKLLQWSEEDFADPGSRAWGMEELDAFLSEILASEAGMSRLLGECKDLGEAVDRLVSLYEGRPGSTALTMAPDAARRLGERLEAKELKECRTAVCKALLEHLERPKRLRPDNIVDEVEFSRELAQKLVMAASPDLPAERLIAIFTARSGRLMQPEPIEELMKTAKDPGEEIGKLVALAENLVGDQNRAKLAGYLRNVLGSHGAERHYVYGQGNPMERLADLTGHQRAVMEGDFPKEDRDSLMRAIDALGIKVISETKILNRLEEGNRPFLDKSHALLKLIHMGVLPIGECTLDAQARALRMAKSPTGRAEGQTDEGKAKLKEIGALLQDIQARQANAA